MDTRYFFTLAHENELDALLAGNEAGVPARWSEELGIPHIQSGTTGVIWSSSERPGSPIHPLALVCDRQDMRRLYGRYAQLRSDLSPLTSWCHVIDSRLSTFIPARSNPDLSGLEAAWCGLAIAEAALLSDRPVSKLTLPECLATESFVIARTKSLWNHIPLPDIDERHHVATTLFKNVTHRNRDIRPALLPVWACLAQIAERSNHDATPEFWPIVEALRALKHAKETGVREEAHQFALPLANLAQEAHLLDDLGNRAPEVRLKLFDTLVSNLRQESYQRQPARRHALALLAGYLATVAAGGAPSLALLDDTTDKWPEITAWAYVAGSIGEKIVWASGFDGLGRLVARELVRPLRLDEPPMCDFGLDEALALADAKLSDPLIHLRIKQSKAVTVAFYPGVNIPLNFATREPSEFNRSRTGESAADTRPSGNNVMASLAAALWPHLRDRVADMLGTTREDDQARRVAADQQRGQRRRSTSELPFTNPRK